MIINSLIVNNSYFFHPKVSQFSYVGNLELLALPKVCVIGSRKMSQYGKLVVENFVNSLVGFNIVTVSGFVEGVDFEVFFQSLKKGVPTIAVLGYGFDFLDKNLLKKAREFSLDKVLFISEFDNDLSPKVYTFPTRDETLAYISDIVLVVEATEMSGTFYTVKRAFKENKKVYAAAGSIFSPLCKGNFALLKTGFNKQKADLYTNPSDILSNFKISVVPNSASQFALTEVETKILNLIASNQIHFDDICKLTKVESSKLSVILIEMELKGLIVNKSGYYFKSI